MSFVIWWIRRDLRLIDNDALNLALESSKPVLPLFVLNQSLIETAAPIRLAFLFDGLRALSADLRKHNAYLLLRQGKPLDVLTQLVKEEGALRIYAEEDYSPYARRRDEQIAQALPLTLVSGPTVHHPSILLKKDETPYIIYTPFSQMWKALPRPDAVTRPLPHKWPPLPILKSDCLPHAETVPGFPAGEQEAQTCLSAFLSSDVFAYAQQRDLMAVEGTSRLSPYLRFGMLSARRAISAVTARTKEAPSQEQKNGCQTWLDELIWREFYHTILYHHPHVLQTAFRPAMRHIAWREDNHELNAWQSGLTGYPVVDAGMRQLAQIGWMHNRARMICASFLVKDLLINWQEGERWFMQNLIDGEPASNNGGWQWTAGTGTDAAPYFRIFNPLTQGKKFDPQGQYVRQWIPELRGLPDEYLHEPWLAPPQVQRSAGFRAGKDYPNPIVDHAWARERILQAYRSSNNKE